GMAHFAPMMKLEAPQLDIGNPFKDYIAQAIAERELELKEKGLGLDEQKLAYNAANGEAQRNFLLELEKMRSKNNKDNLDYEFSLMNKYNDKAKAKEDLIQKEINKYYGYLENLEDQGMDISNPQEFFKAARDHARALGNTDIVNFITNQGAKAAELNNLYLQNHINKDVAGDIIKEYSGNGNGSGNGPRNFRGKNQ
ncbi:hypothetical protein, partial [Campylobacter sp.]|uniref:hypothetical protein n=1 Tax=Campylobacter sp. TaxID=205 RepID=UPI00259CDA15